MLRIRRQPVRVSPNTLTKRSALLKQVKIKNPKPQLEKPPIFASGQKWQMQRGHAEIVQVGKTLVHYKFLKTGMIRGPLEMKSIPNFAEAMKANNAKLIV
jgi:hypothetical protein